MAVGSGLSAVHEPAKSAAAAPAGAPCTSRSIRVLPSPVAVNVAVPETPEPPTAPNSKVTHSVALNAFVSGTASSTMGLVPSYEVDADASSPLEGSSATQ